MSERPQLQRINIPTLHQKVYDELKEALISGRFPPGSVLTIRALAEEFGTSPMPVREALQRLVSEHALEFVGKRTIRVPLVSITTMLELTELRCLLEGQAAAKATVRGDRGLLARLTSINAKMTKASENRSARDVISLNREFHFELYKAAQSEVLLRAIVPLWLQSGPYVSLAYSRFQREQERVPREFLEHQELIDAVRQSKAELAREAVQRDIRKAADEYLRHLVDDSHGSDMSAIA